MARARFGTDGVRGVANDELTAELALAIGRAMLAKLNVYAGPDHPHAAQQPEALELPAARRAS